MFKPPSKYIIVFLLFLSLIFGLYRLYPYFFSSIPLGYDPGIYRDFMLSSFGFLPHIHLGGFVPRIKSTYEPGWGLASNVFHVLGYKVDRLLTFGVGFLSLITSVFIYLALKRQGKYAGILGMILFWISIIQYQTFWRCYIKQIVGILLLLSVFFLFENKKYWISIPLLLMLFVTNRPGGLFFLVVFVVWQIVLGMRNEGKRMLHRNIQSVDTKAIWIVVGSGILALIVYLPVIREQVLSMFSPLFGSIFIAGTSGTFFSLSEFVRYDLFFLLLSLWGLRVTLQRNIWDWRTIGYLVGLVWIVLGLFFFSRIAIFWDIFIIMLASYGLSELYQHKRKFFWWILGSFFLVQSVRYLYYVTTMSFPLIDQAELVKIQQIDTLIPDNGILMVTNKKYSAFVQGWTDKEILAPGLFDLDRWDQATWDLWHQGDGAVKCAMMESYKDVQQPIYIWLGNNQPVENLTNQHCFDVIENGGSYLVLKWKE